MARQRTGHDSTYNETDAAEVCDKHAAGLPLAKVCRENPHLPALRTVYDWRDSNADFAARLARARELCEVNTELEILDIGDDGRNDYMEGVNQGGTTPGVVFNSEHVSRSKLRIESRFRLLAIWNHAKYGNKTTLAGDKANPLIPSPSNEADLRAEIAMYQARIGVVE